jgi:hypothetical protein
MRLSRKIPETSLILKPEYIHPALNRKARRRRIRVAHPNDSKFVHKAGGKLYEKGVRRGEDKVIKNDAYGGKFI